MDGILSLLGKVRLLTYLEENFESEGYEQYEDIFEEAKEAIGKIRIDDEEEAFINAFSFSSSEEKVISAVSGDKVALIVLELLFLRQKEPQIGTLYDSICGPNGSGVILELALRLYSPSEDVYKYMPLAEKAYLNLSRIFIASEGKSGILGTGYFLDDRLTGYLHDGDYPGKLIDEYADRFDGSYETVESYIKLDAADKIADAITDDYANMKKCIVAIAGEKLSGRAFQVKYIAMKNYIPVYFVYYRDLAGNRDNLLLKSLIRECYLTDACLCIRDVEQSDRAENKSDRKIPDFFRSLERSYGRISDRPLFVTMDEKVRLSGCVTGELYYYNIPKADTGNTKLLYDAFLKKHAPYMDIDTEELSRVMVLNAGQIEKAAVLLNGRYGINNSEISQKDIHSVCYEILDDGRYENVHRVEPGYTLADLKVDEKTMGVLQDIINQVRFKRMVYEKWGMIKKYPYGRSISILLAGPPGTGKTMSVHAIASELGLELYKVDLSQLVDKYIGETEKRLEEVFTRAEKCNMILFFDEADAVMGKRTDGNDANEKSANTQIAFILQRLEEYDGIVVLSTNLLRNIDSAFIRRIRYVLTFELPDAATRKAIWTGSFAEGVPLDKDVDFDYLAETFEISGAVIKNIVLNAVFYAAAENIPVCMLHILKAVVRESIKDRSILNSAGNSKYAYLLSCL